MERGEQSVEQNSEQHELTKHELRELKRQQKLEQREQQSAVATGENKKRQQKTYLIVVAILVLGGFALWKFAANSTITGSVVVDIGDHPTMGPVDAKVSLIIFGDFQCPFTRRFWQNVYPKIVEKYGSIAKISFWPVPTAKHNYDRASAQAAYCANEQGKFWEYAKIIFDRQGQATDQQLLDYARELKLDTDAFTDCYVSGKYEDKVQDDYTKGRGYGVVQTPTVNINGQMLSGDLPFEDYQTFVEWAMQNT